MCMSALAYLGTGVAMIDRTCDISMCGVSQEIPEAIRDRLHNVAVSVGLRWAPPQALA